MEERLQRKVSVSVMALFLFFCLVFFFFNYTVLVALSSSFPTIFEAALVTVAVPVKFSISIQHIQYGV